MTLAGAANFMAEPSSNRVPPAPCRAAFTRARPIQSGMSAPIAPAAMTAVAAVSFDATKRSGIAIARRARESTTRLAP